jgi:serine/threonine-protein kinase
MNCTSCGTENAEGARFCNGCGEDLTPSDGLTALRSQEANEAALVREALAAEYEVVRELGRGGMAIVYQAKEHQLDRDVAIKVLPMSLTFDTELVERFQREARTAAKLAHPRIIPIYRVGRMGKVIFFVMKFVRGGSLGSLLQARGRLPPGEIIPLLGDVAEALDHAHEHGIVHRDIKPDNIMFDEIGHCVVTDFGIAKAATGTRLTGTGMSIGTPHYMSPEQVRAQAIDGRSDIYSLGVVGYQALAGSVPFDGEDAFQIGFKHISEPPPPPPLPTPEHEALFGVLRRMLAKDPAARLQTGADVLAALGLGDRRRSSGLVGTASAPTARIETPVAFPDTPTTPMPRPTERPEPRREERRSLAGGLVFFFMIIIGVAGGGGWWLHRQGLLLPQLGRGGGTSGSDTVVQGAQAPAVPAPAGGDSGATAPLETGTIVLSGPPPEAQVMIEGRLMEGRRHDLPPGEYDVRITALGYEPAVFRAVVTAGAESLFAVPLLPELPPCSELIEDLALYNRGTRCYDVLPRPKQVLRIPLPAGVTGQPGPVVLWVLVSPEGRTVQLKEKVPSSDSTFTQAAFTYAWRLTWAPARRRGVPVEAWVDIAIEPAPQP